MDFSNTNNYVTSQHEDKYKTMESKETPSTSRVTDDLCESTSNSFLLAVAKFNRMLLLKELL